MQLTFQVQLLHDDVQAAALLATMKKFSEMCNYISQVAFSFKCYNHIELHNLKIDGTGISLYYKVRSLFPDINSMHVQLALRKVANSYLTIIANKRKIVKRCVFKETSSVSYNIIHTMSIRSLDRSPINIGHLTMSTVRGRILVHFIFGDHQSNIYGKVCESKLIYRNKRFYLHIVVEQKVPPVQRPQQFLGVDFGVVNIATTSSGNIYSGSQIDHKREQYQAHRSSLQKTNTKSSKRRLKLVSKKESNFKKDINHCISKSIVAQAKGTHSGIVLEDLTHIREQITVRRKQRSRMHGWSFAQLRFFIEYKSLLNGVYVQKVDPHHTSQRCHKCGHTERKNRNRLMFKCKSCGHEDHSDYNAAMNLSQMGTYDLAA